MRSPANRVFFSLAIALLFCQIHAIYVSLREYAGSTFFDGWDYYANVDNTTWGYVNYVNQADGVANRLTYINSANNAIIKVDNTTTIAPAQVVNRNSVRLTTKDSYGVGTLWIIDVVHLPYGCTVWPSFWSYIGDNLIWPRGGEIDIIEAINLMSHNQVALHTTLGCTAPAANASQRQTGQLIQGDCSLGQGCIVAETKPNSYGQSFAQAGGGVWALQMDVAGIFVWYWSRPDIPASIKSATSTSNMDTTTFGMPSASYPASTCNITEYFAPQKLVLLTTLCGVWAGVPSIYASTCPGSCIDMVVGNGSNFADAFFEISYLRTYALQGLAASQSGSPSSGSATTTTTTVATVTPTQAGSGGVKASGGSRTWDGWSGIGALALAVMVGGWIV